MLAINQVKPMDKLLIGAFGVALAVLSGIGFLSYRSTQEMIAIQQRVDHTHEVLEGLDSVLANVLQTESATRGFVMSGDEQYLATRQAAAAEVDQTLAALSNLLADDADQLRLLDELKNPIEEKLRLQTEKIELGRRKGLETALRSFLTGQGNEISDQVRRLVALMKDHEKLLLKTRADGAKADAATSIRMLVIGSLLSFLTLGGVCYSLIREIWRRRASESQLLHSNRLYALLSQTNQAIVHARESGPLLQEVCRIAVGQGLFDFAWIGTVSPETGAIVPSAWHASSSASSQHPAPLARADGRETEFALARLREGVPLISNDLDHESCDSPWRADALQRGHRSAAVFPIRMEGVWAGVFGLYSGEVGVFQTGVAALLDEVTSDLAFALTNLEREKHRERAEEALRKQARIIDEVHDAIVSTDMGGNVTSWNKGAEILMGYTAEEALGRHVSFLYPPEEYEFLMNGVIRPLQEEGTHEAEVRMRKKSGKDFYAHLALSLQRDREGRPLGMIGYSMDITKARESERALRESEERFRQMAENVREVFWLTDAKSSRILYLSPAFEGLWGRSCDSLSGKPAASLLEWVHPEDRATVAASFENVSRGEAFTREFRVLWPDGAERWVWDRGFPIQDASGAVYRVAGITQDVTDRKAAEREIRRLNSDLERRVTERTAELDRVNRELAVRNQEVERANRLKSEFLASMSHELRTPLNAIIGFSDLLARGKGGLLSDKHQHFVGHVQEAARHLLQLINDILDLSKIEAGRVELEPQEFSVSAALDEVLSVITPLAVNKSIRVSTTASAEQVIYAERIRFKQILFNLLSNAVKFTPEKGQVAIECSTSSDGVLISVSDTGIGIPVEEQSAVFDEFHQAGPTTNGVKEGTGLGLSITKRLIELHGGRIWLSSEPGKGSCFSFLLPNKPEQSAQQSA
jgi:PAS domain S-box-containing protein